MERLLLQVKPEAEDGSVHRVSPLQPAWGPTSVFDQEKCGEEENKLVSSAEAITFSNSETITDSLTSQLTDSALDVEVEVQEHLAQSFYPQQAASHFPLRIS